MRDFERAGWSAGRTVVVPDSISPSHPAAAILREFEGLNVGDEGPGEECGVCCVAFQALEIDAAVQSWAKLLRTELVGIADISVGYGELLVASDGRFFGRSCLHDAFYFYGSTFSEAMERILRGRRARPMLRPDQEAVSLYGREFRLSSPELYAY